jgi:hypothetical protein
MEPLIDELETLWNEGVPAYDASAPEGHKTFTLRAMLLWTMHDWPGMIPKLHGITYVRND